ncbi:MAG: 30S ribosomal protein S12 methylthiotransferase RimO [Anaerolineales bacterium]|nr:30S ribosomal protein S12 methylthiotransferase RimO [Anaerolineales bacterium]
MKKKTFHLVSLGCAKNTVDSNSIAQLLHGDGYSPEENPQQAELLIVNTCGFIEPAREESYAILNKLASEKERGQLLIAAGCLTQRYGADVVHQIPGIDGVLGTRRWMDILQVVSKLREGGHPQTLYHLPDTEVVGRSPKGTVGAHIQGGSAYLKIADGCRRPCAFCAIPKIKGTAVSRPLEEIIQDARYLQIQGVREVNLIAQDTTDYGHDLGINDGLASLLTELTQAAPDIDWIRILYAYPGYITDRLIEVMATNQQILPYIDIPLQHADPGVLKSMRRPANMDWVYKTVEKLRTAMPDLAIRTTFIVGYPGETEQAFESLLDFIKGVRFDRVGVFEYSFEPGTTAESLGDPVPAALKTERKERLMLVQQGISLQINQALVGKTLDVLIEGQGVVEDSTEMISLGRTYRDAPEIDGMVIVEGDLPEGKISPVRITGAMTYDLTGISASVQNKTL